MARVQVETSLDTNLLTNDVIVRVRYRPEGAHRWTKLVVVPDDDQAPQDLLRQGHEIARAHMAHLARRGSDASSGGSQDES
jgi:hypothetical protein